jgi:site-specific recombinase XerD
MDPSIDLFLQSLKIDKGASIHTIAAYARDLRQFLESAKSPVLERTEEDVQNFLKNLKKNELKSTSVARKI